MNVKMKYLRCWHLSPISFETLPSAMCSFSGRRVSVLFPDTMRQLSCLWPALPQKMKKHTQILRSSLAPIGRILDKRTLFSVCARHYTWQLSTRVKQKDPVARNDNTIYYKNRIQVSPII